MKIATVTFTLILALAAGGCVAGGDDAAPPDDLGDDLAGDEAAPALGASASAVVATCSPNVTCTGTKTCGAWSAWSTCGAAYQRCDASCGFQTRAGCNVQATVSPQNRTRACVMRATGATCYETDYREVVISCPF
ncbi:MAG: hypothetical protein JNK64_27835 [Myxococcales bacterium]|nr:hypothetical protein [Myxococcales bacterium]